MCSGSGSGVLSSRFAEIQSNAFFVVVVVVEVVEVVASVQVSYIIHD
jgi:hypothetical protein